MSHELIYFMGHDEKPDWPESVKLHLPTVRGDGGIVEGNCPEGPTFSLQAPSLYELALRTKPKNIIEIGRRAGFSTRMLLDACIKADAQLWSIDASENDISETLNEEQKKHFHQLVGDGTTYEFPEKAEFVFIDTWHTYGATLAEMNWAWKFVKNPGIMMVYKSESHFACKKAAFEWAATNCPGGFIHDSRGQGFSLFIRPEYTHILRDRAAPDTIHNSQFP